LGCSFDTADANNAFAEKFGYTFPLLCDTDRKIGMAYAAASSPKAGSAARITYVIDESGVVSHALANIDPSSHADDLIALVS
jgi:peroxiredoxin Q/BCP